MTSAEKRAHLIEHYASKFLEHTPLLRQSGPPRLAALRLLKKALTGSDSAEIGASAAEYRALRYETERQLGFITEALQIAENWLAEIETKSERDKVAEHDVRTRFGDAIGQWSAEEAVPAARALLAVLPDDTSRFALALLANQIAKRLAALEIRDAHATGVILELERRASVQGLARLRSLTVEASDLRSEISRQLADESLVTGAVERLRLRTSDDSGLLRREHPEFPVFSVR